MENSWVHKTLGELFVFKNGLNKGKEYFGYGTPIINYMDVYKHPAIKKKYVQGRVTLSHQELDRFRVLKGDVFFTRTSETPEEVGMSATLLEDIPNCSFSGFVLRARPLTDLLIPKYCVYAFTAKEIRASIIKNCTYTTRALTNGRVLASLKLPIPSLAEQQRIASTLSDADALVAELDVLIEKKRAIMAGTMQEFFTGKRRLQGFDEPWVDVVFGDKIKIYRGGSPRPIESYLTNNPNGLNWIKIGDARPGDKYITKTSEKIIPEGLGATRAVYSGDFLLSNSMSFGRPYILKIDGCIHDGWLAITEYQETFDRNFLYYLLGSDAILQKFKTLAAGSGVQNLNKKLVADMELQIPSSLAEQHAIATILSDMDAEIAELEAKRDKYKEVRQGMMQQLLTGKIRLI